MRELEKFQNLTIGGGHYSVLKSKHQWCAEELLSGGDDKRNLPMGLIEDS